MGRLRYVFLPFILMAMLALPVAVPAQLLAAGGEQCLAEGLAAPPNDKCEDCKDKEKKHRVRNVVDEGVALRVYSKMTGKPADALKSACEKDNLTVWQLAKREGKLDALKAKILDAHTAGFDALVRGGVMTEEQKAKILAHMKDELSKQQ